MEKITSGVVNLSLDPSNCREAATCPLEFVFFKLFFQKILALKTLLLSGNRLV